jgi:type II secretory pathway pseudopilin PulG
MSRIWKRLAGESGSIMIEVVVGTVLLALTTAAVLDGLDGAQDTGRKNKDRSTSATLAQQDLERLRSLPPTILANLHQTRAVTVAGVTYTVSSDASSAAPPTRPRPSTCGCPRPSTRRQASTRR